MQSDDEMRDARQRLLARCLAVVGLGCVAVLVVAGAASEAGGEVASIAVTALTWLLPGWLIASRRPRLPFGWLLLAGGLFLSVGAGALAYGSAGVTLGWPAAVWVAWIGGWVFFPHLGCMEATYLLFPTGRLPSPRWRWVVVAIVAVNVAMAVSAALFPGPIGFTDALADVDNPAPQVAWMEGLFPLTALAQNVLNLLAIAVVGSRWRHAAGKDRRALAVVFGLGLVNAAVGVLLVAPVGNWVFVLAIPITMALTVSIAWGVLRHQLWNVRLIVSRTLTWLLLTGLLVAVLAGCVAVVGLVVTGTAGRTVGLVVAAAVATVLVAPIERRLHRAIDRLLFGDRLEPYTVLSNLGADLETAGSPSEALDRLVAGIHSSLKVSYAAIELVGRDGHRDVVAASGSTPDGVLEVPVVHHGRHMGSLVVGQRSGDRPFSPADRRLLEDLARQAGAAAASVALTTALQTSRQRIVTAREEERRRLRQELHDGVASALTAIGLKVDSAAALTSTDADGAQGILHGVQDDVRATLNEVRRVVNDLRPPALADLGLGGALAQLAARFNSPSLRVRFAPCGPVDAQIPAAVELAVYRLATEALQNVARHAGAAECSVLLLTDSERIVVTVQDDGMGFADHNVTHSGLGLTGMRDRVEELGGALSLGPRSDGRKGAVVSASFPRWGSG